ncbi:Peroxiredoxin [Singulisphaera sp. GP187]|uniref:peroxiredoxin family protein n=1 Tax=Singulisphaera sp. GP187 TaxID=1882752 RepID=UPI000927C238|nr:redoxin domain-containing protein [Singulisphaera sp. GP187]SIO57911.1 Peroxiredoxin [Singulisphaera sp. GP187]
MLKCLTAGLLALMLTSLVLFYAWTRIRADSEAAEAPRMVIIEGPTKHAVTPIMTEVSRTMVERQAPAFESTDFDGRRYILGNLDRKGPVVLIFVKEGCPCSDAAQPLFNQVHAAYPGATFLGVINSDAKTARRWADKHRVRYPLLLDPDHRIIRDYNIENSAYVVLIAPEGRIRKHWPGYSSAMLQELGRDLATLVGTAELPLDVADAPEILYSGCPFEFESLDDRNGESGLPDHRLKKAGPSTR